MYVHINVLNTVNAYYGVCSSHRTSAVFLEQPKLAVPSAAIASAKRYTPQNPQAASLPLDKVKVEVAAPVGAMPPQAAVPSGSAAKAPQAGGKQGWDTVRRAFQTPHRGEKYQHAAAIWVTGKQLCLQLMLQL